jgi:hypothetical protein
MLRVIQLLIFSCGLVPASICTAQKPVLMDLPELGDSLRSKGLQIIEVFNLCDDHVGIISGLNGASPVFIPQIGAALRKVFITNIPTDPPVAIKVNKMNFREFSGGQLLSVHVNLDVLEHREDGWHLLHNAGSQLQCNSLRDLGHTFSMAIDECLDSYVQARQAGQLKDISMSDEDLTQLPDPESLEFPILKGDLPVGLFMTLMDLREKRVFVPPLHGPFHLGAVDPDLRRRIWGYSDGLKIFVRIGRSFIPLERGMQVLWGEFREQQGDPAVTIAAGVMFGLLGAAIAHRPAVEYKVNVDLLAGEFQRVDIHDDGKPVTHVLQFTKFTRSADTVAVLQGSDTLAVLKKGQYCVIRNKPDLQPMELELESGGKKIPLSLPLDRLQPKVHLLDVGKNGAPVLKLVPYEMNSKLLERLDPEQRQPVRRRTKT